MGSQNLLFAYFPQGSGVTLKSERDIDEWEQIRTFGGEPMVLNGSTDSNTSSGNSSTFSQQNLPNTPNSFYMDLYAGLGYDADGYALPSRPTTKTLNWSSSYNLFDLYKFVVPKGQEPYFELVTGEPHFAHVTPLSPPKVYLEEQA